MCCVYLCSECDNEVFTVLDLKGSPLNIKYCPFCGADESELSEFRDEEEYYAWFNDDSEVN
jgi:hypothetical protein